MENVTSPWHVALDHPGAVRDATRPIALRQCWSIYRGEGPSSQPAGGCARATGGPRGISLQSPWWLPLALLPDGG